MNTTHFAIAAAGLLLLPLSFLLGHGSGVVPGKRGIPRNTNTGFPSCGSCHNSFPNFNVKVAIDGATSVALGSSVAMKLAVSGANTKSKRGGFSLEASKGSFVAGTTTRIDTTSAGRAAVTHNSSLNRSWSFSWKAPSSAGLVVMFSVGNTANGDGRSSGDAWGWYGPDSSLPGTPYRVYVNGANIQAFGTSCDGADKFRPLMGMKTAPKVGAGFTTETYNLPANSASVGLLGFSNKTFGSLPLPLPLAGLGGGKCQLLVSMDILQAAITVGAGKGAGKATQNWAIPNNSSFRGIKLFFQAMTIDKKANSLGLSFSNGLSTSIQ